SEFGHDVPPRVAGPEWPHHADRRTREPPRVTRGRGERGPSVSSMQQPETGLFEQSAAAFRGVLVQVRDEQLEGPTPCVPLTVAQLVEKAIGHTDWVRAALHGDRREAEYPYIDPCEYLAMYDPTIAAMVDEMHSDGAMTRDVTLAAGLTFSGADVMI